MKTCSKCKKEKPVNEFFKNRSNKDGHDCQCKKCHETYAKKHYWKKHLKKTLNITVEDYDKFYRQQKGRCAICGVHQSELNRRLDTDHSHDTGRIRGLLCRRCNLLLGNAKDDITILKKAITYLKN